MEESEITINKVTYAKGNLLGRGAFGLVFKATNKTNATDKEIYAIKLIMHEFTEDDKAEIVLLD